MQAGNHEGKKERQGTARPRTAFRMDQAKRRPYNFFREYAPNRAQYHLKKSDSSLLGPAMIPALVRSVAYSAHYPLADCLTVPCILMISLLSLNVL